MSMRVMASLRSCCALMLSFHLMISTTDATNGFTHAYSGDSQVGAAGRKLLQVPAAVNIPIAEDDLSQYQFCNIDGPGTVVAEGDILANRLDAAMLVLTKDANRVYGIDKGKQVTVGKDFTIPSLGYRSFCYDYLPNESDLPAINLPGIILIFEVADDNTIKMTAATKFTGAALFRKGRHAG